MSDWVSTHAVQGTYDESYFVNPKTGRFCFPKYKRDARFRVQIIDKTNYREEIWNDLDSEEKREFSIYDFEDFFPSLELEVDDFESFIRKVKKSEMEPLGYVHGHRDVVIELLGEDPEELIGLGAEDDLFDRMLNEGYLYLWEPMTGEQKDDLLHSFTATTLKVACKASGLKQSGKKTVLIDRLIQSNANLDLFRLGIMSPQLIEWLQGLIELYIGEVSANADRFHPIYLEEIWDVAEDCGFPLLENRLEQIRDSKYWQCRFDHNGGW